MEEHDSQKPELPSEEYAAATDDLPTSHENDNIEEEYISDDSLIKHISRQSKIIKEALVDRFHLPTSVHELSLAYEKNLFSPSIPPKKQENGTCEPNPRLNFYPAFTIPEVLATYHIFFKNQKVPLSCRANRPRADEQLMMKNGDNLPSPVSVESVKRIFEGLGEEEVEDFKPLEEKDSSLVELKGDNPRLAVAKRGMAITHFAYPALSLPPKVMSCIMENLIIKKVQAVSDQQQEDDDEQGKPVVSDQELAKWLNVKEGSPDLEERRKTMLAVVLVSLEIECMRRFFTLSDSIKKWGETFHYTFRHGYVKQACKISNIELTNLVSYMGILHENRLGQNILHSTLKGEARRDYIRDTMFLMLIHSWQSGMGVWQQCLESENVGELAKILQKNKKALWSGFDEQTITSDLADLVFPTKLLETLQKALPDFTSQSMMQNFRSLILERSGILPSLSSLLPSDFVPLTFRECPPPLWSYTYILRLANYFMYHTDIAYDMSGEGLMECYCRCNLCTPHRCLATNTPLLNEVQSIGTFEIQGPPDSEGKTPAPLKLTAGVWTSAFLRKFEPADYHSHSIKFYEDQSKAPKSEPSACVITHSAILAQLQDIKKAREEFLLKKGHGVYLDPQTGEELNTERSTVERNNNLKTQQAEAKSFSDNGKPDSDYEQRLTRSTRGRGNFHGQHDNRSGRFVRSQRYRRGGAAARGNRS